MRGIQIEITDAAIGTYRQLLRALGSLTTHPAGDGGLICENRTSRARPTLWRISSDGTVTADSRYSYGHRAFVATALPRGA